MNHDCEQLKPESCFHCSCGCVAGNCVRGRPREDGCTNERAHVRVEDESEGCGAKNH